VQEQGPLGHLGEVGLKGAGAGLDRELDEQFDEGRQELFLHGPDQVQLVGEVQVQGAFGEPRLAGDLLGGRPCQPLGPQDPLGRVDQPAVGRTPVPE
jgi:hypothetical protein